jgi:hypothetical protein
VALDGRGDTPSPFTRPRIIGGLGLLALLGILAIWDAASPDFTMDTVQFGLILGTSLAMLGLDIGRQLLR